MILPLLFFLAAAPDHHCPPGFTPFEAAKKCYKVLDEKMDVVVATDACKRDNAVIVLPLNIEENNFITKLFKKSLESVDAPVDYRHIWLDVYYFGQWMGHEKKLTWFNWDKGMPETPRVTNMVVMNMDSGKWSNLEWLAGRDRKSVVCEVAMK